MHKKRIMWTTLIAVGGLFAISAANAAPKECTNHTRTLRLATNAIALDRKDSRCINRFSSSAQSGTFAIRVRIQDNLPVDMNSIEVEAKETSGPSFEVESRADDILIVKVTWGDKSVDGNHYGFTIIVPGHGVLDPKVQIIRNSIGQARLAAFEDVAKDTLDAVDYEFLYQTLERQLAPPTSD